MKETFEEMASYRISPRLKGKYHSVTYFKRLYERGVVHYITLKDRAELMDQIHRKQILTDTQEDCTLRGKGTFISCNLWDIS